MKNTFKSLFNKAVLSGAALLGLGAGVAQAQQVCAPISAQQIYARDYQQQAQNCSTYFNYQARQNCTNNAAAQYQNLMAQHPSPHVAQYCDPSYVAPQLPPVTTYIPPMLPPQQVIIQQQPIDPLAAVLGTLIIGGAIYHHNTHHDRDFRPHYPRPVVIQPPVVVRPPHHGGNNHPGNGGGPRRDRDRDHHRGR